MQCLLYQLREKKKHDCYLCKHQTHIKQGPPTRSCSPNFLLLQLAPWSDFPSLPWPSPLLLLPWPHPYAAKILTRRSIVRHQLFPFFAITLPPSSYSETFIFLLSLANNPIDRQFFEISKSYTPFDNLKKEKSTCELTLFLLLLLDDL